MSDPGRDDAEGAAAAPDDQAVAHRVDHQRIERSARRPTQGRVTVRSRPRRVASGATSVRHRWGHAELAERGDTITWEIITRIGSRVRRVYV